MEFSGDAVQRRHVVSASSHFDGAASISLDGRHRRVVLARGSREADLRVAPFIGKSIENVSLTLALPVRLGFKVDDCVGSSPYFRAHMTSVELAERQLSGRGSHHRERPGNALKPRPFRAEWSAAEANNGG